MVGQQRTAVTIALVPSVPSGSTFIAADKGYFNDAGLDVKIERIDSLSKAMAFVATNQVQVGQGGINAGYFNGVAQGLPVVMALESGSTPLYHRILLRPELKDQIKTVADLKGRKVGISSPGSTSVYEIGMVLASAGLRIKDIDLKYLAFTQMGAALANGALDAALEVAPFTDIAIEQKLAAPWIDPEDGYIKQLPLTNVAYIANTEWIKQSPDVAKRLFVALAHAGRDYCQAYHHGPNRARGGRHHGEEQDRGRPRPARPDGLAGAQPQRRVQPRQRGQRADLLQAGGHHRQDRAARAPGRCELRASRRQGARSVRARQQIQQAAGLPVGRPPA